MDWEFAPDIQSRLAKLSSAKNFSHVDPKMITAMRGYGSTSRAIARIWSLPRIWQMVLRIKPQYIIEVIANRFDKMSPDQQDHTLIHELMHIPKTFSGALVPHKRGFRKKVDNHFNIWKREKI
jgi:predicted metallopeptidase